MSLTKATNRMISGAPANVLDFGADPTGATDSTAAFQAAIDSGASYIVIPQASVYYLLNSPLNMTSKYDGTGIRRHGITLDFQSSNDVNPTPNGSQPIFASHTGTAGPVIDFTGSRDCVVLNMSCRGDPSNPPTCLFLLQRAAISEGSATTGGAGRHSFTGIKSSGRFSEAVIYNYASEVNNYYDMELIQEMPGKSCVTITGYNIAGVSSPFEFNPSGGQSNTVHNFYGNSLWSQGNSGSTNEVCLLLESGADLTYTGGFMYCPYGIAYVFISHANATFNYIDFHGVRGESGTYNAGTGLYELLPKYGVYYGVGASARIDVSHSFTNWRCSASYALRNGYMIYVEDNITVDGLYVHNVSNVIGGLLRFNLLKNSSIYHGSSVVDGTNIGTSQSYRNTFEGWAANRALTGANTDNIYLNTDDGDVASDHAGVWTPVLLAGATPVTNSISTGYYSQINGIVTLMLQINTAPHVVAGDLTLTGLPIVADTTYYGSFGQATHNWTAGPTGIISGANTVTLYQEGTVTAQTAATSGISGAAKYLWASFVYKAA